MAITSSNVAETMKKNLGNLMDSERVKSSYTAFVDQQNADKTAVIGPIKITLNSEFTDDVDYVQNFIDSSDDGTGTKSSIYFETEGTSEFGDRSIRTEIYPEGQTRADTQVQRDRQRQSLDYETKEIDNKIAALQAEIDASNFDVGKTTLEMYEERIAAADASIAASNASILESKKSLAKSDAILLQAEIDKEMSEAQSERLTELKNKLDNEKGNEGEEPARKKQEFKEKITAGLKQEQENVKTRAKFTRIEGETDGEIDRTAVSGSNINSEKNNEITENINQEAGNKDIGTGDGDNWRKTYFDGGKSSSNFAVTGGGDGSQGDDSFGISPLMIKTSDEVKRNAVRDAQVANENNLMASGSPNGRSNKKSQIKEKKPSFADTRDGSLTGKDPFRFSTLAYPESITTDPQYGHFILFYVNVQNKTKYKYRGYNNDGDEITVGDKYYTSREVPTTLLGAADAAAAGISSTTRTMVTEHSGALETGRAGQVEYQKQQHLSGATGSNHLRNNQVTLMKARKARAGIDSVLDLTTRITDSVAIYLPSAINDNVKAGYQDFNTGFAGFIALSGGKILNQIADNDFEGAAKSFIGKGKDILLDLGKRAAIGAYGGLLSGDGVTNAFDKAFGQTVNPFIEVAFDSMGVRTFNYTFDFRPKSSRETEEVQAIIKLFRFHMVPELKGSNHRYMTLPSTFDIHYMYQTNEASRENEFYSKIATCVLQDCSVNYTPDGVKSFESGAPTHITMTLQFMETEMLTKEKINDGF